MGEDDSGGDFAETDSECASSEDEDQEKTYDMDRGVFEGTFFTVSTLVTNPIACTEEQEKVVPTSEPSLRRTNRNVKAMPVTIPRVALALSIPCPLCNNQLRDARRGPTSATRGDYRCLSQRRVWGT
jgi:hypothetical protein